MQGNEEETNRPPIDQLILNVIDQLRERKARPDLNRICAQLFKKYQIKNSDAKDALQHVVDTGIVHKVEYKGNISYRNPAKKISHVKRDNQNDNSFDNKPTREFGDLLEEAFQEIFLLETDYFATGVPGEKIIETILTKDSVRYTSKYIRLLMEREVESGGLTKENNDCYLMGPRKKEGRSSDVQDKGATYDSSGPYTVEGSSQDLAIHVKPRKKPGPKPGLKRKLAESMDGFEKKTEIANLRVGGRPKKAKKVFDPSDNQVPKKRGRPAGSLNKSTIEKQLARLSDESRPGSRSSSGGRDQGAVCSVCLMQNKGGSNERMMSCRDCRSKVHYSCLNDDDMMLRISPDNTWQCPQCKSCVICCETSKAGYLAVCSTCCDGYHPGCHSPPILEKIKPTMDWKCFHCNAPDELKINEIQSNMSNTFSQKSFTNVNDTNDMTSPSVSGESTPNSRSSPSPTPPQLSPQNEVHQNGDRRIFDSPSFNDLLEDNIDPSIPDASLWTPDEVAEYFAQYFPEEVANIFREQEIDGRSVLLLKRSDVLYNLNMKFGMAVKVYKYVTWLQVRRDDPSLYWL